MLKEGWEHCSVLKGLGIRKVGSTAPKDREDDTEPLPLASHRLSQSLQFPHLKLSDFDVT